jgi:hypothetical protein
LPARRPATTKPSRTGSLRRPLPPRVAAVSLKLARRHRQTEQCGEERPPRPPALRVPGERAEQRREPRRLENRQAVTCQFASVLTAWTQSPGELAR